jgi:ATP-dependent Clp protease ATP-binding subunit ClpC
MNFLAWHYSEGLTYYFKSWMNTIGYVNHSFSIPLLLRTLFSPYKRLITAETGPGFDMSKRFQVLTYNLISRGIGAIVRFILIWVGLILLLVSVLGGAAGYLFWVLLPVLSFSVYRKYKQRPEHVVSEILKGIQTTQRNPIEVVLKNDAGVFLTKHIGISSEDLIEHAEVQGLAFDGLNMKTYHELFSYLLDQNVWSKDFFYERGLSPEDVIATAAWWDRKTAEHTTDSPNYGRAGIALSLTYGYTPTLKNYITDLSTPQSFTHHLIGRGAIVDRIERNLISGQSVFLTGDPGVGKKTVVLEFAWRAVSGQLGRDMAYKRIFEFDYNGILAKSVDLNQKKVELNQALTEAAYAGDVILMIRDIHRLVNPEVEGYDFTDIFESLLEKRNLKIIAISSNHEYERYLSSNTRIRKFFERVEVVPPTKEEAMEILLEAVDRWETLSELTVQFAALKQMLEKSDEFVTEAPFPEKVLELLDAAVTYVGQQKKSTIELSNVNAILAEKTGISFENLGKNEKSKLGNIENLIHERLVNQEFAVNLIAKTLRSKTVGIVKEDRPIGSFLFLGPTGVGKTETAKVLAHVYFGSESAILRFDMAEYAGSEGLERLIGSVQKNMPGVLTTAIKNHPASLLLLDEIEKASREIYNLFLSLLDEGFITDAFGKRINCKNLFVIGTTNAGASYIRDLVQSNEPKEQMQEKVLDYVLSQNLFSPEFVNRFDGAVVYEPLSKENLTKIARLMLSDLAKNLETKNIHLTYDDKVSEKLAEDGYDPAFGARPMRRLVNLQIGDLLGKGIISEEIRDGAHIKLVAGAEKDEFLWEKA